MAKLVTRNSVFDLGYYVTSWENKRDMFRFLEQAYTFEQGFSFSIHIASSMLRNEEEILTHSKAEVLIYRHTMGPLAPILTALLERLQESQSTNIIGSGGVFNNVIGLFVNILEIQYNPDVDEQALIIFPDEEEEEPVNEDDNLQKALISTFLGCIASIMVELPPNRKRIKRTEIVQFYTQFFPQLLKYLYKTHSLTVGDFPLIFNRINFPNQVIVHDDKGYCIATNGPKNGIILTIYRNTAGKYYRIHNLRRFFRIRTHNSNYQYCRNCFKFHNKRECPLIPEVKMPNEKHSYIKETSKLKSVSIATADFEAYIEPDTQIHKLASVGFVGKFQNIESYVATIDEYPNLVETFMDHLAAKIKGLQRSACLDPEQFNCNICNKTLIGHRYRLGYNYKNGKKSGLHNYCHTCKSNSYTVYFHNLKGYDVNFLLRDILETNKWTCTVFAKQVNQVLYIHCVNKEDENIRIQFKDSLDLFFCSIESMATTITNWRFTPQIYIDAFKVSKGTFPYEWFDSLEKFNERSLPIQQAHWFNKLVNKQEDANLAIRAWNILECLTFKDFVKHYNLMDCFILFEALYELQRITHNLYTIDITDYLGIPSITWKLAMDACPEKIQPLPNKELYDEFQQGIRGGVAQVMHRYADLNQFSHIIALDVNALYSTCMTEKLPFELVERLETLDMDIIMNTDWLESNYTYYLRVDLEYPVELHDNPPHRQYPLAPHRYLNRLCTTLFDKEDYLVSVENLQFYLKQGMILTNIHYAYKFKQGYLFKDYVKGNIEKRNNSNNKIEKNNYKLNNNSLYGKTCENIFKYTDIRLIEGDEIDENGTINPHLRYAKSHLSISNDFSLATFPNTNLTASKPIYIGVTILEKAKMYVYRMIYDHLFKKFDPRDVQLCYTDTDSLIIAFRNQTIDPLRQLLNSNCPVDIRFDNFGGELPPTKTLGLWSNDLADYNFMKIRECIFLKAKLYMIVLEDGTKKGRTKGIKSAAICTDTGERLTINEFRRSIKLHHDIYVTQFLFDKKKFQIKTIEQKKLALNCDDQKRLTIGYLSLPLGYKGNFYKELLNRIE